MECFPAGGRHRVSGDRRQRLHDGQDLVPTPVPVSTYSSTKYAAIVVNANDGRVLYQASSDAIRYPASLTKMMTLYLLFEAMESGRVSKTTQIPVSNYARSRPPTKIGFKKAARSKSKRRSWRW